MSESQADGSSSRGRTFTLAATGRDPRRLPLPNNRLAAPAASDNDPSSASDTMAEPSLLPLSSNAPAGVSVSTTGGSQSSSSSSGWSGAASSSSLAEVTGRPFLPSPGASSSAGVGGHHTHTPQQAMGSTARFSPEQANSHSNNPNSTFGNIWPFNLATGGGGGKMKPQAVPRGGGGGATTDDGASSSTAVPSSDYAGSTVDNASTTTSTNEGEEELKRKRAAFIAQATLPKLSTIEPSLRRKSKSGRASVCTFKCRSSLRAVRYAIRKLGWEEVTTETADTSVAWLEHSDSVVHLTPFQVVSKIEGMVPICRKAACAISLNRIAKSFPNAYSFVPKTWVLRRDGFDEAAHLEKIMGERKGWVYIAKPTAGSQGRGVQLVKRWQDLKPIVREVWPDGLDKEQQKYRRRVEFVVQRYVTRPLLVNGLKFDCRVYVLVTSITPLRAYLFEEGLARFCTVAYERPKAHNLANSCMHLTNYAINKKSADFQPSRQHDDGSKRSLSSVFDLIYAEEGPSPETMWQQIKELAERTLLAIKPSMIEHYGYFLAGKVGHHPHGPKGFQIIGMDIIFEDNCRPKLLELNANCSLSCLSPMQDPDEGGVMWKPDGSGPRMEVSALDLAIKSELVAQSLLLANPMNHRKASAGRLEFTEQCGGLPAGSVFQEPLPNEEQRREAKPPRRADRAQYAPAFRPLDFQTNHQAIFDFVQSHEHTYRLFRGLLAPGQTTFTKNSFRSLVISGYFLYERGLEDSSEEEDEAFRIKIFDDMASADAFFARVLFEANRENNGVANGLNYLQFLKYICVELGSRIDDTSEFHAIHAFVRRCVGTYEGSDSSESEEEEDAAEDA